MDLARLSLDLYTFNNPAETEPYDAKEIRVEQAEVSAASAEEQVRALVRTLYYSIRQLEDKYAGLEQSLAAAEENLRIARLKFDLGMATKTDVLSTEVELAKVQKSLLETVCDHEISKLAFRKPWVYGAYAFESEPDKS